MVSGEAQFLQAGQQLHATREGESCRPLGWPDGSGQETAGSLSEVDDDLHALNDAPAGAGKP
jgi:hypothetical protein